jgi:hypothetical protein
LNYLHHGGFSIAHIYKTTKDNKTPAILSLIFQPNPRVQLNICIVYQVCATCSGVHCPFSGRTLITSKNHLFIVRLLQWLSKQSHHEII